MVAAERPCRGDRAASCGGACRTGVGRAGHAACVVLKESSPTNVSGVIRRVPSATGNLRLRCARHLTDGSSPPAGSVLVQRDAAQSRPRLIPARGERTSLVVLG